MNKKDILSLVVLVVLVSTLSVLAEPESDASPNPDVSPGSAETSLGEAGGSISAEDLGLSIEHPYFTVPYSINPSFSELGRALNGGHSSATNDMVSAFATGERIVMMIRIIKYLIVFSINITAQFL